jgi:hypothetical protein
VTVSDTVRKININHCYITKYTSFYLFLSIGKVRYYFYKKQHFFQWSKTPSGKFSHNFIYHTS